MAMRLWWFRVKVLMRIYRTERGMKVGTIGGLPWVRFITRRRALRNAWRVSREWTARRRLELEASR